MNTAKVTRPIFNVESPENPSVKLTATIKHGSVTKEYDLNVIVRMLGVTDSQAVILDLNELVIPKETTEDLKLPKIGRNGSTIIWTSNTEATINPSGIVVRPDSGQEDITVTLTAECKKAGETQTKSFTVKVKSWTIKEEADKAAALVDWDLIKGVNTNSQAVTDNLILPATVGRSVTATWSIISSSAGVSATGKIDIATGVITRPTYTQGQVYVQLKCALVKQTEHREIILNPIILAPAPMTDTEVLNSAVSLLESSKFLGTNASLAQITENMKLPYRLVDASASRATITWALVEASSHSPKPTSPYIALSNTADYMLATITRPGASVGNISIGLQATIAVGSVLTQSKYFDMTILNTGV